MPATGERHQQKGKDGLEMAKLWLESTTRFEVHFTSWGKASTLQYVEVPQHGRAAESFDLQGDHLEEDRTPRAMFYAEVKNYDTAGHQRDEYRKFLTRCYSATLAWAKSGAPKSPEFLWITWHPFGTMAEYSSLTSSDAIQDACTQMPGRVAPEDYDQAVAEDLAQRLWLLILSRRLPDLQMSTKFLGWIDARMREENT